jgi:hypothetical protein
LPQNSRDWAVTADIFILISFQVLAPLRRGALFSIPYLSPSLASHVWEMRAMCAQQRGAARRQALAPADFVLQHFTESSAAACWKESDDIFDAAGARG